MRFSLGKMVKIHCCFWVVIIDISKPIAIIYKDDLLLIPVFKENDKGRIEKKYIISKLKHRCRLLRRNSTF